MSTSSTGGPPASAATQPVPERDIAFQLLLLQQKLGALDRLYNEEVVALHHDLTQLKAEYVRQVQAQREGAAPKSSRQEKKTAKGSRRKSSPRNTDAAS